MNRVHRNIVTAALTLLAAAAWASGGAESPGADTVTAELGRLNLGENLQHEFAFTNTAGRALTVVKVETSCECFTVLAYPETVPPGGVGRVVVNVFGEKAGDFAFAAALEFADKSQRYFIANVAVAAQSQAAGIAAPPAARLPLPAKVIQRAVLARDRSLYKPVADARASVELKRVRVVDVRSAGAFAGLHIAGALNIAVAVVPAKAFLRQGEVLLVDEGFGSAAMESVCLKLRDAGNPKCWILLGGMNAWIRAGAPSQGTGDGLHALQFISPRDYLAVRGFDDWVVTGTNAPREEVSRLLPEVASAGAGTADAWHRVLIVDADGSGMAAPAPDLQVAAVFGLDGGLAALEREYRDMAAMEHSQTRTTDSRILGKRWETIRSGCGCK